MVEPTYQSRIGALAVQRLFILAYIWVAGEYLARSFAKGMYEHAMQWPRHAPVDDSTRFKTWDAAHYLAKAVGGDAPTPMSDAFYPLWPALIRVGMWLTDPLTAALVLANLFTVAGVILLWRAVAARLDDVHADAAAMILLAYPAAFYLALPYSEALFFALSAGFFHELGRNKPWNAAMIGAIMPLVRPPGHFISIIFGIHLLLVWYRERGSLVRTLAPLSLTAMGSLCFFGVETIQTGTPFAAFEAQKGYITGAKLSNLWHPVSAWNQFWDVHEIARRGFKTAPQDRVAFALTVITLPTLWRLDKTWFAWVVWMGIIPPITANFMSGMRYELLAWPVFVAMATWVARPSRRPWLWLLLAVFGTFQVLFLTMHTLHEWVG